VLSNTWHQNLLHALRPTIYKPVDSCPAVVSKMLHWFVKNDTSWYQWPTWTVLFSTLSGL